MVGVKRRSRVILQGRMKGIHQRPLKGTSHLGFSLGAEGTEEINLSHEMTSWAVEAGKLEQLWFGDSE